MLQLKRNMSEPGHMRALRGMLLASKQASEDLLPGERPRRWSLGDTRPDFKQPAQVVQLVATALHASVHMIEGAGHYPHAEMPEQVAPLLISFFQQVQESVSLVYLKRENDDSHDELHVVFGTGAVGLAVMRELHGQGKRVRLVNRSGTAAAPQSVEVVKGDAADPAITRQVCRDATVVYNCVNAPYTDWAALLPPCTPPLFRARQRPMRSSS